MMHIDRFFPSGKLYRVLRLRTRQIELVNNPGERRFAARASDGRLAISAIMDEKTSVQ